jgi:hypothetical protein
MLLFACLALTATFTIGQAAHGLSKQSARPEISFKTGTVDTAAEQDFLSRTNALRASLGLGSLRTNSELLTKARNWSQTQANSGTIFHSTLTNGVTQNWHRLGENVGMGPDAAAIHDALVRSPRHYENLVDPGFTEVGIGVVRQGDVIYVSQVFMEFMPESSTPATSGISSSGGSSKSNSTNSSGKASSKSAPAAEAAPLKTASEDLSAVIKKLSALEA